MDDELEKNYRARIDSESYAGPFTEEELNRQSEIEKLLEDDMAELIMEQSNKEKQTN